MKKLIAMALSVTILMQISCVCFASESTVSSDPVSISSYVEADGTEICIVSSESTTLEEATHWSIKRLPNDTIVTQDYAGNSLIHTSTFVKLSDEQILYTETENGISTSRIINIADYITLSSTQDVIPNASDIFRGTIFFNPKVHNGVSYERSLSIWYRIDSSTRDSYTINGKVGDTISFLAGLVTSVLTLPLDFLTGFLASALVAYIVDNVVVKAFTETVNAINTNYTITSVNNAMNTKMYHSGSSHHVDIPGRRDEIYNEGDLPFGDPDVAYRMFNAHWPNDWTGLNYFYYAYEGGV